MMTGRTPALRCLLLAAAALLSAAALAQAPAPTLKFTAVEPLKMPPDTYFGEVAGVATNSRGHVFIYMRTGDPTATLGGARAFAHNGAALMEFDAAGKFVREIGKGAYGFLSAQQVRVDAQDNVWAVDAYSGMVIKFDPTGSRILLLLGRKPEDISVPEGPPRPPRAGSLPGAGAPQDLFAAPADVSWDAAGNIYVADGVGTNTRIAKFDKAGVFLKSWGSTGSGDGQFADVHSIAIDAAGNVYAADAGNKRIQVFDGDGAFKRSITGVGAPAALCLTKGPRPKLFSSNSNPVDDLDTGGEIYQLDLDGRILGRFGRAGKRPGEFGTVNAIDCRTAGQLYVGEVGNYRVQKLTLR